MASRSAGPSGFVAVTGSTSVVVPEQPGSSFKAGHGLAGVGRAGDEVGTGVEVPGGGVDVTDGSAATGEAFGRDPTVEPRATAVRTATTTTAAARRVTGPLRLNLSPAW